MPGSCLRKLCHSPGTFSPFGFVDRPLLGAPGTASPKPIPRWDVHFGILKTTERTPRLVISPLVANRVGTDSAILRYVHFTLALV